MSDVLDKVVAEARVELGAREAKAVDWTAVDAGLFARIEGEHAAERARFAPPRRRGLTVAAVGLAAAAALVAVMTGKSRDSLDGESVAVAESAGIVLSSDDDAHGAPLLVDGTPAARGTGLRLGDVLETRGTGATIERPGKLALVLEPGSRTAVSHVKGALVLALERGAVEAQVVPVASGEAFAVDVEGARVAVHGTHLRVARDGDHVVIDLSEGVVSIGPAPRAGSVLGTLVNAPAHIEFTATDPAGTLTQTHDPSAVRRAVDVRSASSVDRASAPSLSRIDAPATHVPALPGAEPRVDVRASSVASGTGASPKAVTSSQAALSSQVPMSSVAPVPSREEAIADVVRGCMSERLHSDNVTLVVSTTLHLELGDDGSVRSARFDPPVAPEVNTCAAQAIYHQHFGYGGAVSIAIDFTN